MDKRLELLEQKRLCDTKLAKLRAQLLEAKADARCNGRYMRPADFAQLDYQVRTMAQRSQEIQAQLRALKINKTVSINDCFRDAAAKMLPEKTFLMILEAAYDMKKTRQQDVDAPEVEQQ